MAKRRGVRGWHEMRKDQLVRAILRLAQRRAALSKSVKHISKNGKHGSKNGAAPRRAPTKLGRHAPIKPAPIKQVPIKRIAVKPAVKLSPKKPLAKSVKPLLKKPVPKPEPPKPRDPRILRRIQEVKEKLDRARDLAAVSQKSANGSHRDRLVVMVRDPYWLHACWEMTRAGVERAKAALSQDWHTARPVLRLLEVASAATQGSERLVREVEIHGGVNNWYIDVRNPPCRYRVEIGYRAANGRFHSLAKSNAVTTPKASDASLDDRNWSDVAVNFDKIFALSGGYADNGANAELRELFEERLKRPMGSPMSTRFGVGPQGLLRQGSDFAFAVDAVMIVYGVTHPGAYLTVRGEPVRLRDDGTFAMRMTMTEGRQVIPVVASTGDGVEERTVVLAIERNTKVMEPVVRDPGE